MADAFEDAFEMWLDKKSKDKPAPANETLSEPMSTSSLHTRSAPILVDDDDEEEHENSDYLKNLGAGPPVLEPVTHHPHPHDTSDVRDKKISEQKTLTSSQSDPAYQPNRGVEKPFKTYSAYGNMLKRKKLETDSQNALKSSSENIFDKFIQYKDDSPPPLIPSPMSEDQQISPESEPEKYAGKSPDFCAMEADSTSELQSCCKELDHVEKEKGGSNEISLECDSTCMLGGSPAIVSPASHSTSGDADDPGDGFKGRKTVEIQCNADSLDEKPYTERSSSANIESDLGHVNEKSTLDKYGTVTDQISFGGALSKKQATLFEDKSVGPDLMNSSPDTDVFNSSPAFSAGYPSARQQQMKRKHRHTVDSAEGFSKTRKLCSGDVSDLNMYGPPPLLSVGETEVAFVSAQSRSVGEKPEFPPFIEDKALSNIHRHCYKRSNTVPVTGSQQQADLAHISNVIWQLSQLQTRMHTLLSQLWPRLQLGLMSPESPQFNTLLSDLVTMLEQPEIKVKEVRPRVTSDLHSGSPSLSKIGNAHNSSSHVRKRQSSQEEKAPSDALSVDHCSSGEAASSSHQTTDNIANPNLMDPGFTSPRSDNDSASGSSLGQQQNFPLKEQQVVEVRKASSDPSEPSLSCLPPNNTNSEFSTAPSSDNDFPLLDLSRLSLKGEKELCLKPVQVALPKNPESALCSFSNLVCRALQLLLPDVTVSLNNELSSSPQALIAFIDNVRSVNVKRSHKKRH